MIRSPNDADPPDMEHPLEEAYCLIYGKFPWAEDLTDSDYEAWPHAEIQKNFEGFIQFVLDLGYASALESNCTPMMPNGQGESND